MIRALTALRRRSLTREPGDTVSATGACLELSVTNAPMRPAPAASAAELEILDDRAFIVEAPIGDDRQHVAIDLRRIGLIDDERAVKAAAQLLRAERQDARPVTKKPAVWRREAVVEAFAGRDRLLRQAADAVHRIDDANARP